MKTADRENPNRRVTWPRNRAHGAVGQNRSRSSKWAAKQEKFQPKEMCFFLTSTFIEPTRSLPSSHVASWVTIRGFVACTKKLKLLSLVRYGDLEAYVVDMLAEAKLNRKGVRGVANRRPIKRVPKADVVSDSWMEN